MFIFLAIRAHLAIRAYFLLLVQVLLKVFVNLGFVRTDSFFFKLDMLELSYQFQTWQDYSSSSLVPFRKRKQLYNHYESFHQCC